MLGWRSKPSPKRYNVMLAWVLQNIHRNEDRNCSSGLGKVEKGSGSRYVRHSRHSDHTGGDEPGGLPEAMHTRCEQDEMDGHPSSLCLFFFFSVRKKKLYCPVAESVFRMMWESGHQHVFLRSPTAPQPRVLKWELGELLGWHALKTKGTESIESADPVSFCRCSPFYPFTFLSVLRLIQFG